LRIDLDGGFIDTGLNDRDETVAVELPHGLSEQAGALSGRRRWREDTASEVRSRLKKDASGLTCGGISDNHPALWIRGIFFDPGKFKGLAVDGNNVPAAGDEHRVVGRDLVELITGREASFLEQALMPTG
jgi:hypothetical protein